MFKGELVHDCKELNHEELPFEIKSLIDRKDGKADVTLTTVQDIWNELEEWRLSMKGSLSCGEVYYLGFKLMNICPTYIYNQEVVNMIFKAQRVTRPTSMEFDKLSCTWIEAQALISNEMTSCMNSLKG